MVILLPYDIMAEIRHETTRGAVLKVLNIVIYAAPPGVPTIMVTNGIIARRRLGHEGITLMYPEYLVTAADLDMVCFDKTGTLTRRSVSCCAADACSIEVQYQQGRLTVKMLPLSVELAMFCHCRRSPKQLHDSTRCRTHHALSCVTQHDNSHIPNMMWLYSRYHMHAVPHAYMLHTAFTHKQSQSSAQCLHLHRSVDVDSSCKLHDCSVGFVMGQDAYHIVKSNLHSHRIHSALQKFECELSVWFQCPHSLHLVMATFLMTCLHYNE